jgi:hypothetical protein
LRTAGFSLEKIDVARAVDAPRCRGNVPGMMQELR